MNGRRPVHLDRWRPDVHDAIRRARGGFDRIARGVGPAEQLRVASAHDRALGGAAAQPRASGADDRGGPRAAGSIACRFWPRTSARRRSTGPSRGPTTTRRDRAVARSAAAAGRRDPRSRGALPGRSRADFVVGGVAVALADSRLLRGARRTAASSRPCAATRRGCRRCSSRRAGASVLLPSAVSRAAMDALDSVLNAPAAVAFRRELRVNQNDTCQRCVCSLSLPLWGGV